MLGLAPDPSRGTAATATAAAPTAATATAAATATRRTAGLSMLLFVQCSFLLAQSFGRRHGVTGVDVRSRIVFTDFTEALAFDLRLHGGALRGGQGGRCHHVGSGEPHAIELLFRH